MLGKPRRLAVLAEGSFAPLDAKTAIGVLRYRPAEVAAVIDSTRAGRTAAACVGVGGTTPVVAGLDEAAALGADALLIGIAPQGGQLPAAWRDTVCGALERGWDVLSGLHVFLGDDPELARRAEAGGARLIDARRPPATRRVAAGRAARVEALVALTVGTDCNVGKMTAALEIVDALRAQGVRAAFVATGQTGIFIADHGVAVDAVPADFVAGEVEALVLEAAREAEVVVVEGQGALHHAGYSGVTLALIHGAAPRAMVLCHEAGRERVRITGEPGAGIPIPSLPEVREAYETAARWTGAGQVVAVALNTRALDEPRARAACEAAGRATGLPAADPVRFGAGSLAQALLEARVARGPGSGGNRAPAT
ncbi:MAG: hypothetical protein A2W00_12275 [Candidatus Eisenbacteria bacterium RBG_16_71_46]|nr:MAG: hypothetical protein A2W00_12275 [Candidatus Eisenbacteria bacterium RBG_16_71_46]